MMQSCTIRFGRRSVQNHRAAGPVLTRIFESARGWLARLRCARFEDVYMVSNAATTGAAGGFKYQPGACSFKASSGGQRSPPRKLRKKHRPRPIRFLFSGLGIAESIRIHQTEGARDRTFLRLPWLLRRTYDLRDCDSLVEGELETSQVIDSQAASHAEPHSRSAKRCNAERACALGRSCLTDT